MSAIALPERLAMPISSVDKLNLDRPLALGVTIGLHVLLGVVLLMNLSTKQPQAPSLNSIKIAMVAVAPNAKAAMSMLPPAPSPMSVAPPSKPAVETPESFEKLAHKRVDKKPQDLSRDDLPPRKAVEPTQQKHTEDLQNQSAQMESERLAQEQRQRDAAAVSAQQEAARQAASRQYLPIEKKAPTYPQRALDKEIEGTCTVSYTVNAAGRVEHPQISGECNPLFIRPSLEAAKGFRYEPRIVDGKAVAVPNVKNTFQYRIEQ